MAEDRDVFLSRFGYALISVARPLSTDMECHDRRGLARRPSALPAPACDSLLGNDGTDVLPISLVGPGSGNVAWRIDWAW